MPNIGFPELVVLLVFAPAVVCFCRIFEKAGFPSHLGLLMLVPGVNLFALCYLAFADWPIHARVRQMNLDAPADAYQPASGDESAAPGRHTP